jgi:hypothetical protein
LSDRIGVETRLEQLAGDDRLLAYGLADETDDGGYYVTLRCWPHPYADGATTISLRYAYLTNGDGSDGWVDEQDAAGINLRCPAGTDPGRFLQNLAQLFAAGGGRHDGDMDPFKGDLREE